jgi:hypothetical protein
MLFSDLVDIVLNTLTEYISPKITFFKHHISKAKELILNIKYQQARLNNLSLLALINDNIDQLRDSEKLGAYYQCLSKCKSIISEQIMQERIDFTIDSEVYNPKISTFKNMISAYIGSIPSIYSYNDKFSYKLAIGKILTEKYLAEAQEITVHGLYKQTNFCEGINRYLRLEKTHMLNDMDFPEDIRRRHRNVMERSFNNQDIHPFLICEYLMNTFLSTLPRANVKTVRRRIPYFYNFKKDEIYIDSGFMSTYQLLPNQITDFSHQNMIMYITLSSQSRCKSVIELSPYKSEKEGLFLSKSEFIVTDIKDNIIYLTEKITT